MTLGAGLPDHWRLFTPAEANRTLPLVRRIVQDMLQKGRRLRELANREEDAEEATEIEALQDQVRDLIDELREIGCDYKDWSFDLGLVDFPAKMDDRLVLLCWRSDEPEVSWYHDLDAGYAGRQRIPVHLLT